MAVEIVGREPLQFCPLCEARCGSIEAELAAAKPPPPFMALVRDALRFPATDLMMVFVASFTFALLKLLAYTPSTGAIWAVLSFGIYAALMMRIIAVSVDGAQIMPEWPRLQDLAHDILHPALLAVGAQLISFGPALVVAILLPSDGEIRALDALLGIYGLLMLPIALVRVATTQRLLSLNPVELVRSAVAIGLEYLLTVGCLLVIAALSAAVQWVAETIPYAGFFAAEWVSLYGLAVLMRLLGLLYQRHAAVLNWFGESDLSPP